jgi:FMN phosphatase YigB (HAD superfamily)
MVGNDLAADVAGAHRLGMISVWLNWAPRDRKTPANDLETPRHTSEEPPALLLLLSELERQFSSGGSNS